MSKISLSQLETARRNPVEFAQSLGSGSNARFSKYMAWQLAIHEYHKNRADLAKSINYFVDTFTRNFADNPANDAERDEWISELDAYDKACKKSKLIYVESKKVITVPVVGKVTVGGQLPLVKMNNKGGYSIYSFSRDSTDWESELRFPIIQSYVAHYLYGVEPEDVEVGVYAIDSQRHEQRTYTSIEISTAFDELRKIGRIVLKNLST